MSGRTAGSVAILAGGKGTRLQPAVKDRPKPLALVNGRPFVCWLLDAVAAAGFSECVLCTGHLAGMFRTELGDRYGELRLIHSVESEPLGTGGALRLVRDRLAAAPPAVVLNGDTFCGIDFRALLQQHAARAALVTVAAVRVEDTARFGRLRLGDDGAVLSFEEKGATGPGMINAGIYVLSPAALAAIPEGASSLERNVLPSFAGAGRGMFAFETPGPFLDIGTPETYASAASLLAAWTSKNE